MRNLLLFLFVALVGLLIASPGYCESCKGGKCSYTIDVGTGRVSITGSEISDEDFKNEGMSKVVIDNTITSIGKSAFEECDWLNSVTVGGGVTSFGNKAFISCQSLQSFCFLGTNASFGTDIFAGESPKTTPLTQVFVTSRYKGETFAGKPVVRNDPSCVSNCNVDYCAVCVTGELNKCQTCNVNYYLKGDQCVDDCGLGYYKNENEKKCEACDSKCGTCETSATNCSTCVNTKFATPGCNNSQCSTNYTGAECTECAVGYYNNSDVCEKCDARCGTCETSATNCSTCVNTKFAAPGCNNSQCSTNYTGAECTECAVGYYNNSGVCEKCDSKCGTCETSATNCLTCNNTKFATPGCNNSQCITGYTGADCTGCAVGYYDAGNGVCEKCDSKCGTCQTNATNCLTCNNTKFTTPGCSQCITGYTGADCTGCAEGYYKSGNGVCEKCDSKCGTCQTNATNCLTCANTKFAAPGCDSSQCVDGYGGGNCSVKCSDIDPHCTACSGAGNCTACNSSLIVSGNKCVCNGAQYFDSSASECKACVSHCKVCTAADSCATCEDSYTFDSKDKVCKPSSNSLSSSYRSRPRLVILLFLLVHVLVMVTFTK